MKYLILIIFLLSQSFPLIADEIKCKKFDIKCKTSKYIKDTKEFQKKGFKDAKKQLNRYKK
jgi:hypothetical protein|tara:strand:- start:192 stop:374 length:183 start_codon:yes stop_codon:yes gene_type:complete